MTTSEWPAVTFISDSKAKVAAAKVLMVGAGGIGCELIKTLVLTGFRKITIVDMDTIEISNLNRQFLFRKPHVGMSKALVAAEAVKGFCPDAEITALQENVKDARFDVAYIKSFDFVLNGLDNDEARRHVNRLCLAANVRLVESGTAGYKGQVSVHIHGVSECYECTPRPPPKGFPICTIRNTPDKPIHCIVWAKDLLCERLFGPPEVITDLDEQQEGRDNGEAEADADAPAASEYVRGDKEDPWVYALRILDLVFHRDVDRVARIAALWEERAPPKPLPQASEILGEMAKPKECPKDSVLEMLGLNAHEVWTVQDTAKAFVTALYAFHVHRPQDVGDTHFTKDDDLVVTVVAAAANLRSQCYGIPRQSEFVAKGMAGNIIHAIATTNAIISGFVVLEALKLINGCQKDCRTTYLAGAVPNTYGKVSFASELQPPNPACMVCGRAIANVSLDTSKFTLGRFVGSVLKQRLAFVHPMITYDNFMYEEGEDLDEDEVAENAAHLPTALADLPGGGIRHNSSVSVTDQVQDMKVTVVINHQVLHKEEYPEGFVLSGDPPARPQPAPKVDVEAWPSTSAAASSSTPILGKRKAENAAEMRPLKRHAREDDGIVVLDSGEDEGAAQVSGPTGDDTVIVLD